MSVFDPQTNAAIMLGIIAVSSVLTVVGTGLALWSMGRQSYRKN